MAFDVNDPTELQRLGGCLGRNVKTPDGIGVLIGVSTPSNGLHYESFRTEVVVYYGMDNIQNGRVSGTYRPSDVKKWRG